MMKIYIVDSFSHHNFHEIFNASLLIECTSISDEVTYCSGSSSMESVKQLIDDRNLSNVIFNIIPVIDGDKKVHIVLRFLLSMLVNGLFLLKTSKKFIIIYSYNNAFSLTLINFMNKIFKKRIVIFCHGEFEIINQPTSEKHSLFWSFYFTKLKRFFMNKNNKISDNIIFFVLGDNIKDNLKNSMPNNIYTRIHSLEHSYVNNRKNIIREKKNEKSIINVGMIGQVRKGKNISDLILLANNFSSEIASKKIDISISGAVSKNYEELQSAGITLPEKGIFLSREEYDGKIDNLDYILFFYNKDMYKFTASGPFMDALFFEKPIIALRNNYFEYMFKKYGEFGILVDSIDEMTEIIKEIINGKKIPNFNFKEIQEKLQPEKIALQLKKSFEEAGFDK